MHPLRIRPGHGRLARGLALVAGLALGLPGLAPAQVADAVIEVVVVDESQAVLPGVTITATRPDTGFTQSSVTDDTGMARLVALQPGTYTVKVELQGFTTLEQENVTLRVGQTARLSVTLRVAQVSETVNVIGEVPLVDVYKTDSSTSIIPEQIEALPVPNRDFQQLAFLAPGVQRERGGFRFIGNQPVIGAGGNASNSTILVDGVDFTDPVLGLARARFSQDAISEFRVITNRFDTEIGGSAGGALSIVTKSGTNQLRGSALAFFRDDALRAKPALELKKNPYSREQFGFTLGGPIVRDQTHVFGSFEQINEDNITPFRPQGVFASQAADFPLPVNQSLFYTGVDHRINDSQNLRGKFMYERYRQENFRVGGFSDLSNGMRLDRDNWNLTVNHAWTVSDRAVNQVWAQFGRRKFEEPNNSSDMMISYSVGNTLSTGSNFLGDQLDTGDVFEVRDSFYLHIGTGQWAHDLKFGGSWQHIKDDWTFPLYPKGWLIYANDPPNLIPFGYYSGTGSAQAVIKTDMLSFFVQDDLRPSPRVTINVGLRYDVDTNGNNPDYTDPKMTEPRGRDTNNFQPRAGVSWDLLGNGSHVVRGGVGIFTGRFLLVPAFQETFSNGYTGRITSLRLNVPPFFPLNPANPGATGYPFPPDAWRIADELVSPWSTQVTGGYTVRLGGTGLFADFEGIYVKGEDEIIIRDTNWRGNGVPGGRPDPTFSQINTYTNDGHSEYKAFVASVNGTIRGGHVLAASWTVADKKNINDDFSPAVTDYPNDPADIEAEWGRSRADERYRFAASGIFRLPYNFTAAPVFSYGSGQPWNRRLGYDRNGDNRISDRADGMPRFSADGPNFASVDLRVMYRLPLGQRAGLDLIAEAFNLFNRVNYDVNSVQSNEFRSGPTPANPAVPLVPNPAVGTYLSTLPPREFQLGLKFTF